MLYFHSSASVSLFTFFGEVFKRHIKPLVSDVSKYVPHPQVSPSLTRRPIQLVGEQLVICRISTPVGGAAPLNRHRHFWHGLNELSVSRSLSVQVHFIEI